MTDHRTVETPHCRDRITQPGGLDLLAITGAADLVRAPVATLRYWRHLGTGPTASDPASRVVYRAADLHAWIAKQAQDADSGSPL